MKSFIASFIFGSLCSQLAMAQLKDIHNLGSVVGNDKVLVQSSLNEIQSAHEQTNYLATTAITNDQKERLRYVNDRLGRAEELLRQVLSEQPNLPQPPPPFNPPPQQGSPVEMYKSDSCKDSLIGMINFGTNCQSFAGSSVWGIKVNGQCIDTLDMSGPQACETFKDAGNPNTLKFFKSDSCKNSLSAVVTAQTNCDSLSSDNSAWAVSIGGQCKDLTDTSPKMACKTLRGAASSQNVEIYKSDKCSDNLVAIVDRYTDCSSLKGLSSAWAVKINGQCQDISDTDIVTACNRFKP